MYKCKHCDDEIVELDYEVDIESYEYGTAFLSSKKHTERNDIITDYDYSGSGDNEWKGRPIFKCQNCCEEIDPEVDLIWEEDEQEEKENNKEIEETPNAQTIFKGKEMYKSEKEDEISKYTTVCKKCKHLFLAETGFRDEIRGIQTCPKCSKVFSI